MVLKKTPYNSYSLNSLPKGCQLCVKGKKSVLFISGVCSRNCFYCSLSQKRKNKDIIWVNEREINPKDKNSSQMQNLIDEIKQSKSKGIGITGGDPLLFLDRTIKLARQLKKHFTEKFHIHIYLPTKKVNKQNLKKLSKYIDEVRFHPEFLIKEQNSIERKKDIDKIKLANLFWKKENIGIELPILPDQKEQILEFIIKITPYIGFVNLNELEISDANFKEIIKNYNISNDTYTISNSKESGLWILEHLNKLKSKLKIKVHLCTANTKNLYQFRNRLKLHKVLPYGKKTDDGTVIYLAVYLKENNLKKNNLKENKIPKKIKKLKKYYFDKKKNRILLSPQIVPMLISQNKYKIERVEEFPTYDQIEVEREVIAYT